MPMIGTIAMAAPRTRRLAVLLVESDAAAAQDAITKLESRGYELWHVDRAEDARTMVQRQSPDVILMEIKLPDADGLLLLAALRETAQVPILVCSGTSRKRDAALSLKLGADEFMRKPLDVDEFEIRLDRTLRAAYQYPPTPAADNVARIGPLVVDYISHQVVLDGQPLALTPTEFRLLEALVRQPGAAVPHAKLAELLWSDADTSGSAMQAINMHMHRLRAKLSQASTPGLRIISLRGVGYRLDPPTPVSAPIVLFPSGEARAS